MQDQNIIFVTPYANLAESSAQEYSRLEEELYESVFGAQYSKRSTVELTKLLDIQIAQTYIKIEEILGNILKKFADVQIPSWTQLELYQHCTKISTKALGIESLYGEVFGSFKKIIVSHQTKKMLFSPEFQPSSGSLELWHRC